MVKNLPAMQETQVWSLGWEDPLEMGTVTHSSILAWRIPWSEEPRGLHSIGSQQSDTNEQLTLPLALQYLHTHHHHPESIVHVRAHTWCCAFYRSGQTYDMYPTFWYHTEYFHSPKTPLCTTCSSPLSQVPGSRDSFYCQMAFSGSLQEAGSQK